MMRFYLYVLVALMAIPLQAQTPEESIRNVMKIQSEAWNAGDVDGFMKYYWNSPELTFVSKRGVSKGWQQVYDNYKKGYPDKQAMGSLTFDQLVFEEMNGTTYMVTGHWWLEYEKIKDSDRVDTGGWFTLIFKKFKKDWLIVYDHTS
jgi:ketosteroid isomerase-like protein